MIHNGNKITIFIFWVTFILKKYFYDKIQKIQRSILKMIINHFINNLSIFLLKKLLIILERIPKNLK